MYQSTLKACKTPQSYHLLKSLTDTEGKVQEKAGASHFTIRQHVNLSSINLHTMVIVAAIMFG